MNVSDYNERLKNTGRNDLCPCGSGKKYKKCHLEADEAAKHEELLKAAEERKAAMEADENESEEASGSESSSVPRRDGHQHSGKFQGGRDRHVNIPRRGAI